jgi:hypothetical protein
MRGEPSDSRRDGRWSAEGSGVRWKTAYFTYGSIGTPSYISSMRMICESRE